MPRYGVPSLEFTPAEIAAVTGVSAGLQREWRYRNILPRRDDAGWTRVDLDEVVRIYILKKLGNAGLPLKQAQKASAAAVEPVMDHLKERISPEFLPQVSVAAQPQSPFDETTGASSSEPASDTPSPDLLIFWPEPDRRVDVVQVKSVNTLSEIPQNLVTWTALDTRLAADHIAKAITELRNVGGEKD